VGAREAAEWSVGELCEAPRVSIATWNRIMLSEGSQWHALSQLVFVTWNLSRTAWRGVRGWVGVLGVSRCPRSPTHLQSPHRENVSRRYWVGLGWVCGRRGWAWMGLAAALFRVCVSCVRVSLIFEELI
jgi:hypothetical protein